MNDLGVVVGQSIDAQQNLRAFSWTVRGGMRALPGPMESDAYGINNRNQIVGLVQPNPFSARANRWNPDGTLTSLGPLPARISFARAINDSGMSVGDAEVALNDSHAIIWDRTGKANDLGTFGGSQSSSHHINANGQMLGTYYRELRGIGFLWCPTRGMIRIGSESGDQYVTALNNNGEVAGNNLVDDGNPGYRYRPFIWSQGRGMRALPVLGAADGRALALNNRRQLVGYLEHTLDQPLSRRATSWNDVSSPIDLNTLLYRAPAGLQLYAASAINDDGAIVADSNAGLVLLRPGRVGSAAPVLGPITGGATDNVVTPGATVEFTVGFVDSDAAEWHRASVSIDDGCPRPAPSLRLDR